MQTFSVRSNAVRNARSHLGKGAQQNVHFLVSKNEDNTFSWAPVENAPPVSEMTKPEAVVGTTGEVVETDKPVARKLVRMITSEKGASLDSLVNALGWQKHTIRGAISTAVADGIVRNLKSVRDERRGRVYKALVVASKKAA
jgi:Protein of unknown function (DUF3489)